MFNQAEDVDDSLKTHLELVARLKLLSMDEYLVYKRPLFMNITRKIPRVVKTPNKNLIPIVKKKRKSEESSVVNSKRKSLYISGAKVKKTRGMMIFLQPFLAILIVFAVAFGIEMSTIFTDIAEARQVHNLIQVYGNTIDWWNYMYLINHAVNSAILWGKDRQIMDQPAYKTASVWIKFAQEEMIPLYRKLSSVDLGNFTSLYREQMNGNFNFCDNIRKSYGSQFENCGEGDSSMWTGNLYSVMVKTTALLQNLVEEYERVMDNTTQRTDLLRKSSFRCYNAYHGSSNSSWFEHYYTIMIPLSNNLERLVNKGDMLSSNSNQDATFFAKLHGTINFLAVITIFFVFVKPMRKKFRTLGSMVQLLPFNLLSSNKGFALAIADWNKWNS